MCEVCSAENRDWKTICGTKSNLRNAKLYKIYVGRTANIKLCKMCDIDLFMLGENNFLKKNIQYAVKLSSQRPRSSFD